MHGDGFVGFGLLGLWIKRRPLLSLETSRVAFRQIRSRHSLKDSQGISFSWPRPTFEHLNVLPGHRQGLFPTGNLVMTLKKGPQLIFLRCCTFCAVKIPDVTQRYFTRNCLCPNNNGIVPCFFNTSSERLSPSSHLFIHSVPAPHIHTFESATL